MSHYIVRVCTAYTRECLSYVFSLRSTRYTIEVILQNLDRGLDPGLDYGRDYVSNSLPPIAYISLSWLSPCARAFAVCSYCLVCTC